LALKRHWGGTGHIVDLRRLTGGASAETWAFWGDGEQLILRRAVGNRAEAQKGDARTGTAITVAVEAQIQRLAAQAGVPVAQVRAVLDENDHLGAGYIMDYVPGETIARKILRDDEFAAARPKLAAQCGEAMARIHRIPPRPFDGMLAKSPAPVQLEQYRTIYQAFDQPHPVFEWALRWLAERVPEVDHLTLVHGDFRNGNLMIGPEGLRAVLDWELAHLGDPMEDLGWICVNSWRFGVSEKPVGGFGERDDLFQAYEQVSGQAVDPERVRFWEIFGTLKWGIMCMIQCAAHLNGTDRSVERAAIGRRSSETEIDLLHLIAGDPS